MSDIENIIVKHFAGSHAYGTATPTSDVDFRGIFLADKKAIMTPFFNVNEKEDKSEEDTKFFELNRFMQLYTDGNPNVIETLWVDESDVVESTDMYWHLRQYNAELLSKNVVKKFTGFAHNMCHRMQNHNGWINKEHAAVRQLQEIFNNNNSNETKEIILSEFPEFITSQLVMDNVTNSKIYEFDKIMKNSSIQLVSSTPPKQHHFIRMVHNYFPEQILDRDFNIMNYNSGYELIPYGENIYGLVCKDGGKCINLSDGSIHKVDITNRTLEEIKQPPKMIVKFNKEEWKLNSDNRNNFHTWKQNRNVVRSELEKGFGYDTKNALHTVRLLRMAEELLTDGVVNVRRKDAQELLDVRDGKWKYEEVVAYFKDRSEHIRNVLAVQSTLNEKPNYELASKILIELREQQWYSKK